MYRPNRIPRAHPPSSAKVNSKMRQSLPCADTASNLGCMKKLAQPLAHRRRQRHRHTDFGGVDDDSWESYTSFWSVGTCLGYPCSCNARPVSVVSIEAEISQQVGELRCVRCMHAKHIAPTSVVSQTFCLATCTASCRALETGLKRIKIFRAGIDSRWSHFHLHESRQLDHRFFSGRVASRSARDVVKRVVARNRGGQIRPIDR